MAILGNFHEFLIDFKNEVLKEFKEIKSDISRIQISISKQFDPSNTMAGLTIQQWREKAIQRNNIILHLRNQIKRLKK